MELIVNGAGEAAILYSYTPDRQVEIRLDDYDLEVFQGASTPRVAGFWLVEECARTPLIEGLISDGLDSEAIEEQLPEIERDLFREFLHEFGAGW